MMKCSSGLSISAGRNSQKGLVLILTLILLVAMTLGAIALIRSVDTGNLVAGNLAFQQSTVSSADAAVEDAVTWLQSNSTSLDSDRGTWYIATVTGQNPSAGQTWESFWNSSLDSKAYQLYSTTAPDSAGNTVKYVIHRQCSYALPPTQGGNCAASPSTTTATGNEEEAGQVQLTGTSSIFYRITIKVGGPRNTASYIQVVVSL